MFDFLKTYIVKPGDTSISRHHLYPLVQEDVNSVEIDFVIPNELKLFYEEVGYGFFHRGQGAFYRLMDPENFRQINLKEDFYEFDPQLEIYDTLYNGTKLLFFEVIEGNYLAIDKIHSNGKNAVYHFDKRIANSLEEFLVEFDRNPMLLEDSPNT